MNLPEMLREAIARSHVAIEQTEAAKTMIGGTIDRGAYATLMAQMGYLHASLETLLAGRDEYGHLYHAPTMARADVIVADLAALEVPNDAAAFEATERLIDSLREWDASQPWKLVGALYVVEGSRMGSMALVRPVAKALGVEVRPGTGVDYHLDGLATRPMVWQKFKAQLASHPFTDAEKTQIAEAATETMEALQALYEQATAAVELAVH